MVTYLTEISMFMVKVHLKIMKSNFMYFNEKFVCSIVIWRIIAEKIDCFLLPLLSYIKVIIGEGNGTPIQYPCLENPMDGRAWQAPVHGVAKSRARLSHFTFTFHFPAWEKEMATHSSTLAWRIPGMGNLGAAVYRVAQSQTWLKWLSSSGKASLVSPSITESISQGHCPAQEKRTRENSMPQGQPVLPSKDWPSSVNCWKELHGQSWGRNSALSIFHPVRIKTRTQST